MVYNNNNRQFNNMRFDAIRRSQEMYRRSDNMSSNSRNRQPSPIYTSPTHNTSPLPPPLPLAPHNPPPPPQPPPHNPPPSHASSSHKNNNQIFKLPDGIQSAISGILGDGLDNEKLVIIALMIILAKEGADMKLILALGYILL